MLVRDRRIAGRRGRRVMADNPDRERDEKKVREALKLLGEYFDSVQIFCTRCEMGVADGTVRLAMGVGNWYSRYGLVKEWTNQNEETARERARRQYEDGD